MKRKPSRASLHELRDQLCSILITAQMLEARLHKGLDPRRAQRCAEIAAHSARRMAELLDALDDDDT